MNQHTMEQIRNIALVGHSHSGKTSLSEAILFSAGVTSRIGRVEDGTTKSDYTPDEIARKISISATMLHCEWKGTKLNIFDTPGYADFTGEVKGALRAVDGVVVLLNAMSGVEVGTEKVWGYATEYNLPCLLLVNHTDKEFANFDKTLASAIERFGNGVVALHLPVNPGLGFNGIVDILRMRAFTYATDGSGKTTEGEVPAALAGRVAEMRDRLIEAVAESDDALTEKYLEQGELSPEDVLQGLRAGVARRMLFPLLCSDAPKNIGTDLLLDTVVDDLPSPRDRGDVTGKRPHAEEQVTLSPKPDGPLAAVVFKTLSESHVGELSFFRITSGTLKPGDEVLNSTQGTTERIGQIYVMNGKDRGEVGLVAAGDIAALVKLKHTKTGDTLCGKDRPVILPGIQFPEPVIHTAILPRSKGDEEKISMGLSRIHEEDSSFTAMYDPEIKQTVIYGQGELHLEVVINKLKSKFGVEVDIIEPRIPYREAIVGKSESMHRHKKQTGGRGQFGEVFLRMEPNKRGAGFEFEDDTVGGAIPGKFVPSVEKGIQEAMTEGVLAGYPVVDVKVSLHDGSFHAVDSSDMAFKIAGSMAFKKGFMDARPILLEPIYHIEVTVPEEFAGDVMGDLSGRRGKIQGMEPNGHFQTIKADVPLSELHRYSTSLRSMTQGRGDFRRKFARYESVPGEITQKIVAEAEASGQVHRVKE